MVAARGGGGGGGPGEIPIEIMEHDSYTEHDWLERLPRHAYRNHSQYVPAVVQATMLITSNWTRAGSVATTRPHTLAKGKWWRASRERRE